MRLSAVSMKLSSILRPVPTELVVLVSRPLTSHELSLLSVIFVLVVSPTALLLV
jgi:hypothetical protein